MVGIATFDSTIHFYSLKRALQQVCAVFFFFFLYCALFKIGSLMKRYFHIIIKGCLVVELNVCNFLWFVKVHIILFMVRLRVSGITVNPETSYYDIFGLTDILVSHSSLSTC